MYVSSGVRLGVDLKNIDQIDVWLEEIGLRAQILFAIGLVYNILFVFFVFLFIFGGGNCIIIK